MKIKFLTFSNRAFLPKALICKQSIEQFYPPPDYGVEIVPYEAPLIDGCSYLQGFAEMRIKVVKDRLQHCQALVMLGADCILYDAVDSLLAIPGRVVLVPHMVSPPRNAGRFYRTGHANGDVVLFRKDSGAVIDWLLSQPMKFEPKNGMFFEQTLLSALPFIFDGISICKDPAINYAYYNFFERKLRRVDGRFFINERPLALCQFSGYLDGQPDRISRYYNGPPPSPEVLTLFRDYEKRLNLANPTISH